MRKCNGKHAKLYTICEITFFINVQNIHRKCKYILKKLNYNDVIETTDLAYLHSCKYNFVSRRLSQFHINIDIDERVRTLDYCFICACITIFWTIAHQGKMYILICFPRCSSCIS